MLCEHKLKLATKKRAEMRAIHNKKIKKLKKQFVSVLYKRNSIKNEQEKKHQKNVSNLKSKGKNQHETHKLEIDKLIKKIESDLEKQQGIYNLEIARLKTKHAQDMKESSNNIERLKKEIKNERVLEEKKRTMESKLYDNLNADVLDKLPVNELRKIFRRKRSRYFV